LSETCDFKVVIAARLAAGCLSCPEGVT